MPHFQVEIARELDPEEEVALLDAVHGALVEAFEIPERDRHGRLLVHATHRLAHPPSATPELTTLVTVDCFAGRSLEAKRRLYEAVVRRLEKLGVPGDHVSILLRESRLENWGVRGGRAACDVDLDFTVEV